MTNAGNLTESYTPAEMEGWAGCTHLDCLPACDSRRDHCERLARFLVRLDKLGCPRCHAHAADPVLIGPEGHICGECWTADRRTDGEQSRQEEG